MDLVDKFNYLRTFLVPNLLKEHTGTCCYSDSYLKAVEQIIEQKMLEKFMRKQTQIRSLESLNISLDKYGSLLCPVLLKILPHDLAL